jgi:hypothetical protein
MASIVSRILLETRPVCGIRGRVSFAHFGGTAVSAQQTEFALGERDTQCETLEDGRPLPSVNGLMQTRDGAADRSNQAAVVCHP